MMPQPRNGDIPHFPKRNRFSRPHVMAPVNSRQPAIFFGHGNPMNALGNTEYSSAWAALGARLSRPRAVLCISAHWYVPQLAVTAMPLPRTIHDFGGFPRELFAVQYPARGDPALAREVQQLLAPLDVDLDDHWGLDHGTWSVLCHVFPTADVPVVQLSIDETRAPHFHYEIGQQLRPLRDAGVLIMGSGDIVHNLHAYAWGGHPVEPYDWATRFESRVRDLIAAREHPPLVDYGSLGKDALLSVPTPEHYLPLLYVLGAAAADDAISFPVEGMDGGSVSMLTIQFG
jgi:4,5-DOPA dioxygenase extradiol